MQYVWKRTLILALLGLSLGVTAHAAWLIGRCVARCPIHQFQCSDNPGHLGLHHCPQGGLGHQF